MSEYDEIETERGNVRIKDGENWLLIADTLQVNLYPYGSRIAAETDGSYHWFLWTDLEFVAKVEKAAKECDGITVNVTTGY